MVTGNILFVYLNASVDTKGHADVRGRLSPYLNWLCCVRCLKQNELLSSVARFFSVNAVFY